MKLFYSLFSLLFLTIVFHKCWSYVEIDDLIVQTNDGEILGRYITSESGRTISAFMGIPFATPPVGDLRFKPPQNVTRWNGILSTQNPPPKCPQIDTFSGPGVFEGVEDCLYLNVYVPEKSTDDKLDVLVWIHGGAFVLGYGGLTSYGPDYILDHDVILVAGNYRLGALGFLSTEDASCPGNFGLKDQTFLLQWVQENIEHFGGDKSSVTIWGESAGAASVHYHMISPMSRGLFHRAILNSGTLNNAWSDPARSGAHKDQAIKLAQSLNCPTQEENAEEIVECLRSASVESIVNFTLSGPYPVIESFESDDEAFISSRNYDELFRNSVEIPILLGINSEEGLLSMAGFVSSSLMLEYLVSNWNTLPNSLGYGHLSEDKQEEATRKINAFYFGNETTPDSQLDRINLVNLFTDAAFIGIVETIKHRLGYSNHQSTYVYLYTHKGTSSFSTASEFFGTTHADDLISLFPMRKSAFYSAIPTDQDIELTQVMSLMWTNFARFGNPTPNGSMTPNWPLATNFPLRYMQIGNQNGKWDNQVLQSRVDFYSARANFWMELREEYQISSWLEGNSSTSMRCSLSFVGLLLLLWYFVNY